MEERASITRSHYIKSAEKLWAFGGLSPVVMHLRIVCDDSRGGLRDSVLPDLIEQCLVADLQQRRRLFPVPVGLLERLLMASASASSLAVRDNDFNPPDAHLLLSRIAGSLIAAHRRPMRLQFVHRQILIAQNQIALHEIIQLAQIPGQE